MKRMIVFVVLLHIIVAGFLLQKLSTELQAKESLQSLMEQPELSDNSKQSTFAVPVDKKNKLLKLWIAKTVSFKDVHETFFEIGNLTNQEAWNDSDSNINGYSQAAVVKWKLFCYQNTTHQALLKLRQENNHSNDQVEIIYSANKKKVFFWYNYMKPTAIPDDIDYVWMMDGDILLRYMSWRCFWRTVLQFQPAIAAPALLMHSQHIERDKTFPGAVHPHNCELSDHPSLHKKNRHHNLRELVAIEVVRLEQQMPLLSRKAWSIVHSTFSEILPEWGDAKSNHGPDLMWCGLLDHKLYNITPRERAQQLEHQNWKPTQNKCTIKKNMSISASLPHSCLYVHATPVPHLDTRSNKKSKGEKVEWKDFAKYNKRFKNYIDGSSTFYRAYFSKTQCQECKQFQCVRNQTGYT